MDIEAHPDARTTAIGLYVLIAGSWQSRRGERERTEFLQRQHQDATNRSIDETKDSIRRAIEEVRRDNLRYSQTVTDFQNETADASIDSILAPVMSPQCL